MKFIHLTDTHLVAPGQSLHGLDPYARLEACVACIRAEHADAAFCVLTGDVADAGDARAYAAAREVLGRLPMPVHLLPGNHDARAAMRSAFTDLPGDGNGFAQHAFRHGGATFVLLDTLEPERGSGGALCERRVGWLSERLAEAGSGPVYLFMHHPPFAVGIPALDRIGLADAGPFTRAVAGAGNVRHIFFGHVHRPISGHWRGISFSTLYGTSHQSRLDLEEPTTIAYTAEPPAYSVVLLGADLLLIHTRHFLADVADIKNPDDVAARRAALATRTN